MLLTTKLTKIMTKKRNTQISSNDIIYWSKTSPMCEKADSLPLLMSKQLAEKYRYFIVSIHLWLCLCEIESVLIGHRKLTKFKPIVPNLDWVVTAAI